MLKSVIGRVFSGMRELSGRLNLHWVIRHFNLARFIGRAARGAPAEHTAAGTSEPPPRSEANELQSRLILTTRETNGSTHKLFTVQIKGLIHGDEAMQHVMLGVSITDITEGTETPRAVHSNVRKWQDRDSPQFAYRCDLGKLPDSFTTISDWMTAAEIEVGWLSFARKGQLTLDFDISILSYDSGKPLARARCRFPYANHEPGYLDQRENSNRTRSLAVALAFAVSAADKKLYDCEIKVINDWVKRNIDVAGTSRAALHKLDKALAKTMKFFRDGNSVDTAGICKEITEIASPADRYEIIDLCLRVARAKGLVSAEEIALLKDLAEKLELDPHKFHEMTERMLPVNMYQTGDMELALGVTADMSRDQTRKHLVGEYRKWNARVTCFDSQVRAQADQMLELIAGARNQLFK